MQFYFHVFIRPSSDGTYYGMVMSVRPSGSPSVQLSVRPSVRPGLRPPVFYTFLQHALTYWAEILHIFCLTVIQIKFECRQFASSFVGVMPLLELRILEKHSFPHFSLTCFDILSWNFAYDFVLLYYRSSSSVVNFWRSYAPFGTKNTWNTQFSALFSYMLWHIELKFCIWLCFRTFLLHALTYWAEILHMTLFYCTTDQVRVSSICVNFCWSYAPFGTKNTGKTQFSALFSYMLWHMELKFCIWLCFTVLQIKFECRQFASIFVGVMPPLQLRILEKHSFPHFSLTRFDILSWNFAYNFVVLYYRSSSSVVNLRQFLLELCPLCN